MSDDEEEERELERMYQRAAKRGAELRKQGNVSLGAWQAYQRMAACSARVQRIGAAASHDAGSKKTDELLEAANALLSAGEEHSAYLHAMTNRERDEYFAALAQNVEKMKESGLTSV